MFHIKHFSVHRPVSRVVDGWMLLADGVQPVKEEALFNVQQYSQGC